MMQPYDTIVIGLGAAGVTAAASLVKAGRRVLGLEAQGRIGGRVNTVPFGDGLVELGAEWIHGDQQNQVYDMTVKHNIATVPQALAMKSFRSDGTGANSELVNELLYFCMHIVDHPPNQPEPLGKAITKQLMEYIKENKADLLKDQDFITEFLEFANLVTNNYESSNDWNDVTTMSRYTELEGNQLVSWHKHGYKTFFDILLNQYKDGPGLPNLDIKLNTEVSRITTPQDPNEKVVVTCKDGKSYVADTAIITVSIGVLKEIDKSSICIQKVPSGEVELMMKTIDGHRNSSMVPIARLAIRYLDCELGLHTYQHIMSTKKHSTLFSPPLPKDKKTAIDKISIGVMDKVIISFENPWWPLDRSFFGFIWRGEDKKKVGQADYWTTRIYGASRPLGSSNSLTLWTSGNVAKEVESLPENIVKKGCVTLLQRFMGDALNITVPPPTGIIRSTWHSNPYTRGSYSFDNLLTPQFPDARGWLGAPLTDSAGAPRVMFAGEATNLHHFSTVHGACETGLREAMRILPGSSKI